MRYFTRPIWSYFFFFFFFFFFSVPFNIFRIRAGLAICSWSVDGKMISFHSLYGHHNLLLTGYPIIYHQSVMFFFSSLIFLFWPFICILLSSACHRRPFWSASTVVWFLFAEIIYLDDTHDNPINHNWKRFCANGLHHLRLSILDIIIVPERLVSVGVFDTGSDYRLLECDMQ